MWPVSPSSPLWDITSQTQTFALNLEAAWKTVNTLLQVILTNWPVLAGEPTPTRHPVMKKRLRVNGTHPSLCQLHPFNNSKPLPPDDEAPAYCNEENTSARSSPPIHQVRILRLREGRLSNSRSSQGNQESELNEPFLRITASMPGLAARVKGKDVPSLQSACCSVSEREETALVCISPVSSHQLSLKNKHVFVAKMQGEGSAWTSYLLMWRNYTLSKDSLPHWHNVLRPSTLFKTRKTLIYSYPMILKTGLQLSGSGRAYNI